MKTMALVAAAAALMTAAPAAAAGGYLGVQYANSDVEFIGDLEADTWRGEGAFGRTGGGWGAQLGGSFGNSEFDTGADADVWTAEGHLYWNGGAWRLGGVVAHSELDFGAGGTADETVYGIEAMFDTSANSNIFGSLTAGEGEFIANFDSWNFDAGLNYYLTPNARVGGYLGAGSVDFGGADADTFAAGVNGEFQPFAAPVSITLGWNYSEAEDISVEGNSVQIGARWNFGGGTLQDRNNATPFTVRGGVLDRLFGLK